MALESVFYAYIKHAESDFVYVGMFETRTIADRWWRAVSESTSAEIRESIERHHSQYYVQKSLSDVTKTLTDPQGCPDLRKNISFSLINGVGSPGFTIIPTDSHRDLVSGQSYFIRSKTDPALFWHGTTDSLKVSRTDRTLYQVSRHGVEQEGSIMIHTDGVKLKVADQQENVISFVYSPALNCHVVTGVHRSFSVDPFPLGYITASHISYESGELALRGPEEGEVWELV